MARTLVCAGSGGTEIPGARASLPATPHIPSGPFDLQRLLVAAVAGPRRGHGTGKGRTGSARRHPPVAGGGGDASGRAAAARYPTADGLRRRAGAHPGPVAAGGAEPARADGADAPGEPFPGTVARFSRRSGGEIPALHRHRRHLRLPARRRDPFSPRVPRAGAHRTGGAGERAQAQRGAARGGAFCGAQRALEAGGGRRRPRLSLRRPL